MSDFSTRLRKIRQENNLSQDKLAELLECSRTKITGWEKKEPTFVRFLNFLYNDYDVNLNWLLTNEGNPYNDELENEIAVIVRKILRQEGVIK